MTMLRNDDCFLQKWVEYYGGQLGRENLYIYFDGLDQNIPEFCEGTNVVRCQHVEENVVAGDRRRARFLSREAAKRFEEGYRRVIGTDVDEFLIADPDLNISLPEFLMRQKHNVISGLGVDVGHHLGNNSLNITAENDIDFNRPLLSQRRYGFLYPRYTKASVISAPLIWGSGFHRVKNHNFHIAAGLFLFHFGCVDLNRIKTRCNDSELVRDGWSRHLKKRARTIRLISKAHPRKWLPTVNIVRKLQQFCRPVFALNKPTLFGLRIVVEISRKFKNIV